MVFQWILVQKPLLAMVFQWFPMVVNHWSDDGMVTIHRSGLSQSIGKITSKYFFPMRKCFFGFKLLDTGPSYCIKSKLCTGTIHYPGLLKQTSRSWGLDKVGVVPNKHLLHPVICQVIPMSEFFHDMIQKKYFFIKILRSIFFNCGGSRRFTK